MTNTTKDWHWHLLECDLQREDGSGEECTCGLENAVNEELSKKDEEWREKIESIRILLERVEARESKIKQILSESAPLKIFNALLSTGGKETTHGQ